MKGLSYNPRKRKICNTRSRKCPRKGWAIIQGSGKKTRKTTPRKRKKYAKSGKHAKQIQGSGKNTQRAKNHTKCFLIPWVASPCYRALQYVWLIGSGRCTSSTLGGGLDIQVTTNSSSTECHLPELAPRNIPSVTWKAGSSYFLRSLFLYW